MWESWLLEEPAVLGSKPLDSDLPRDASLDELIAYSLEHSPALRASAHRSSAARERVTRSGTLPDPRVGVGIVLDETERKGSYVGERYTISQEFPWPGKLGLRVDVARERAHAQAWAFEEARLASGERVTRALFEHAYLREELRIALENRELLESLESVALELFRTGKANQADVHRTQVELGRIEDRVRSVEDLLGAAAAELNAALGRPAHAPLPDLEKRPSEIEIAQLPDAPDQEWLDWMRETNPGLAAARHKAASLRHAIDAAGKEFYPDILVGLEYAHGIGDRMAGMDGGGSDMLMAMVSVNLPLWRRSLSAGVREAWARYGESVRQIQDLQQRLETELKQALFAYRDGRRKLQLYDRTLLPRARQSLASTEAAYRAGGLGFSDLIDTQRVLLEFSLAHQRAAVERAQAAARIRTLIGPARSPSGDREP